MKKKKSGITEELKRVMKAGRLRQGLTQAEAGKLLGITQEAISRKESNMLKTSIKDAVLLAEAYGVEFKIGDVYLTTGGGRK